MQGCLHRLSRDPSTRTLHIVYSNSPEAQPAGFGGLPYSVPWLPCLHCLCSMSLNSVLPGFASPTVPLPCSTHLLEYPSQPSTLAWRPSLHKLPILFLPSPSTLAAPCQAGGTLSPGHGHWAGGGESCTDPSQDKGPAHWPAPGSRTGGAGPGAPSCRTCRSLERVFGC